MKDLKSLQGNVQEATHHHIHDINIMKMAWEYAREKELSEIESFLGILIDRATNTQDRLEAIEVDLRETLATA